MVEVLSCGEVVLMRPEPFCVSVRESLRPTVRIIVGRPLALQELPEVALFPADVRILASSKTQRRIDMRRFLIVAVLTFTLASSALAGEIPSGGIVPPPPPPPDGMQASTTTIPGEIPSGGWTYQIADTTVDLVQMLLGFGV